MINDIKNIATIRYFWLCFALRNGLPSAKCWVDGPGFFSFEIFFPIPQTHHHALIYQQPDRLPRKSEITCEGTQQVLSLRP